MQTMQSSKVNRYLIIASSVLLFFLLLYALFRDSSELITLKKATALFSNKKVQKVIDSKEYYYLKTEDGVYKISKELLPKSYLFDYKIEHKSSSSLLFWIIVATIVIAIVSMLFRFWQKQQEKEPLLQSQNLHSEQELKVEPIQAVVSDVDFEDIGGIDDVKEELLEIIDFLKNPQKYKRFGARLPRGVLLVGPPGVGKTMIAKAVAKAAGVSFYYQSGASFVQIYVGMGAKRVHELFSAAKKDAPAIIFIDEIDAVGKKRDGNRNDEREATLNQLLTEMDGFESQSGVIVLAATNKIDVLDPALLRAGRFDRRIFVELPTKSEREDILSKYLAKVPHEVDVSKLASMTVGFNGATLAAFVNEATLLAIRQNCSHVTMEHFYAVKDKVLFGKKKVSILTKEQKANLISYQAAKVVVATYFDLPFEKLLLANERLTPPSSHETLLQSELEKRAKMLLAGVVQTDMKYHEHLTTVASDIEELKNIIHDMVHKYGMGSLLFAKEDEEQKILERLYSETQTLLELLATTVARVEEKLAQNESISKDEVQKILDEVL